MNDAIRDRLTVDRLRMEMNFLQDVMDENERVSHIWPSRTPEVARRDAERAWHAAVSFGLTEWEVDHPCRAIENREAAIARLAPDLTLRALGAETLPGIEAGP